MLADWFNKPSLINYGHLLDYTIHHKVLRQLLEITVCDFTKRALNFKFVIVVIPLLNYSLNCLITEIMTAQKHEGFVLLTVELVKADTADYIFLKNIRVEHWEFIVYKN